MKTEFSKIRMGISVKSTEPGVELLWDLKQEESNTFSIKIKRRKCNEPIVDVSPIDVPTTSQPNSLNGMNIQVGIITLIVVTYFDFFLF